MKKAQLIREGLLVILLVLVFCFLKSANGEELCLRLPLGSYARINYSEYLRSGHKVDEITETIILQGDTAISFLLRTKTFPHQVTVCNLEEKPITMELDGQDLTLDNIGAIAIKPGANLEFKEIQGQVIVIVTQSPDAVNNWYKIYNSENFPQLFGEKRYNISGVISTEEWRNKGVTVIEFAERKNQWTEVREPEWLIDSMALGANLAGVSLVQSDINTDNQWIPFTDIRKAEEYHNHPNASGGNFVEVYYIVEGMAAIAYEENREIKIKIMGPGDMWVAKDETPHTILSLKGPYKHLAIQIPSVFQYGFAFKRVIDLPPVLQRIVESRMLDEILSSVTGTYVIEEVDAVDKFSIRNIQTPPATLSSSL